MKFIDSLRPYSTLSITAVMDEEESLSYSELWKRAQEFSQEIPRRKAVLLRGPRSCRLVSQLLACWMADAVPLMLDPAAPDGRIEELIEQVRPALVFDRGKTYRFEGAADYPHIEYLVSTSGSSGRAKVVKIGFGPLESVVWQQMKAFDVARGSKVGWILSPGFDASLSDIGVALYSASTLVCGAPDVHHHLSVWLEAQGITHLDIPPVLLTAYRPNQFPKSLKTLVVGGEASAPAMLFEWARSFRVVAVYGPAEATICSSMSVIDECWDKPYIGMPLDGVFYEVEGGELLISGDHLALGYLRDRPGAFTVRQGKRFYHTGDLVGEAHRRHGLLFRGRKDRQVQLKGQRVELEEIERRAARVLGHGNLAVVQKENRLFLFWEARSETEERQALLTALERELPPAWVPQGFLALERLPRNNSEKIDYHSLAAQSPPLNCGDEDSLSCLQRLLDREREGLSLEGIKASSLSFPSVKLSKKLKAPRRCILLTGASGRLGRRLLPLLRDSYQVLCLSRRPLDAPHLIADLSQPNFGLAPEQWEFLHNEVDEVLNLAGCLQLNRSFAQLRTVNADALVELLRLGKPVHHASTLAVCLAGEEASLHAPCSRLFGGYAQSKFLAEHYLDKAGRGGVTLRYGQLLGEAEPDELLCQVVRGLASFGVYPESSRPDLLFDVTELQWAAQETARLLQTACESERVVVSVHRQQSVHYHDLLTVLQQRFPLKPVSSEVFFNLSPRNLPESLCQQALWKCGAEDKDRAVDLFLLGNAASTRSFDASTLDLLKAYVNGALKGQFTNL